jgi:hypothetical protein
MGCRLGIIVCSMTRPPNHQPVLVPVAQDDCQKFTVGAAAGGNGGGNANANLGRNAATSSAKVTAEATTSAKGSKATQKVRAYIS